MVNWFVFQVTSPFKTLLRNSSYYFSFQENSTKSMTADFLWPIAFQNLDLLLRQWQPLLTEKEIWLTTTSSAETETIICDLHSFGETFDYISHHSVLLEVYIFGLFIARDLWKHRYLNAYGFDWSHSMNLLISSVCDS